MLRDERQSKQKQFRIDLCKSLDMHKGGGGKEGEKWGKVGEKGRRKKEGEEGYILSICRMSSYLIYTIYIRYFSTDVIRYHDQSSL